MGRSPYIQLSLFLLCPILATLVNISADSVIPSLDKALARAVADSTTHSFTGATLVLGVFGFKWPVLLLSYFVSAMIDIDHFICAGSMNLTAATRLDGRPFFHDTLTTVTCCLLLAVLLELYSKSREGPKHLVYKSCELSHSAKRYNHLPFVLAITVSLLAHHTRDALRRGFWFRGFFVSRAITYCEMNIIFTFLVVVGKVLTLLRSDTLLSLQSLRTRGTVYVV